MAKISVSIDDNSKAWQQLEAIKWRNALGDMGDSILASATVRAPILTGALRRSGVVSNPSSSQVDVIFGSDRVPYARKRHYENKKHPGTRYYLKNAGDTAAKKGIARFIK